MLENVNWSTVFASIGSAAGGVAVAAYKFGRVVKVDRRNDQTIEFAESHYEKLIEAYVKQLEDKDKACIAQLAVKDNDLMKKDMEIVRLQLKIDQINERKDKIVSRHYQGKDIFQQTEIMPKESP